MKYNYRAVNREQYTVTGSIDASDERGVARQLKQQGLVPVSIEEEGEDTRTGRSKAPGKKEIMLMLHQLITLLNAGVSLDYALVSLAESTPNAFLMERLGEINKQIRRGESFSSALIAADLDLPEYIYLLCEAGEMTGDLAKSLNDGLSQMEYEYQLRKEFINALIYPVILVVSGIAAVLMIFILVVPKFSGILEKGGDSIPFLARAVLSAGTFLNQHMAFLAFLVVVLVFSLIALSRSQSLRQQIFDTLTRGPVIGDWLLESDVARWSSLLARLLMSKIELTKALELAQKGVSSSLLRSNLSQVTTAVKGGSRLADALKESGSVSMTGFGLIRIGEQTSELPKMLLSLSHMYTDSGRERMKNFLTLLEPVSIILIGAVIGVIMTGVILAITSVNEISI